MIRFDDILRMRQKELKHYLAGHLKKLGYETVKKKGFLYAEGTVPVLLVAHLDTVHNELPHIICRSEDGRYIMSPQGIGGDDRCGVYMILQIISEVRCHVLFCEDEETGGQGAKAFERSGIQIDVNYIVEVDRRGNNDAVFYNCDNPKFSEFVCSFGFREAMGSFSDISVVAPYLKTAAVNISAGYYNEHRLHEVIDWSAIQKPKPSCLLRENWISVLMRSCFPILCEGIFQKPLWISSPERVRQRFKSMCPCVNKQIS